MTNLYHILDRIPPYNREEMSVEYEELAQNLVKSGRMRIDTDDKCNFARFSEPGKRASLMFSKEELTEPALIDQTRSILLAIYGNKSTELAQKKVSEAIKSLRDQIRKLQPVHNDLMIKLARLFVQSIHPIAIKWLLLEKVEVFISYSHNIGDMMDIVTWKHAGTNSGMQSTDGRDVAIFVSCGGNPFGETSKEHPSYGDGFPAMARLQIIAGQEIGHYSDIMRNAKGQQIGRHSADFACTKAKPHVRKGRHDDLSRCNSIEKKLYLSGMANLIKHEESVHFYRKSKIKGFKLLFHIMSAWFYKQRLLIKAHSDRMFFVKRFSKEKYMGIMLRAMIADMKFNLAPIADVYKRDDKDAEEAIACVEALARVPQQVNKWGYLTTKAMMEGLYHIYYGEVILSLIECYRTVTGNKYVRNYAMTPQSLIYKIKKLFKSKEAAPLREV